MSLDGIQGSGSAYYANMDPDGYKARINTPANSPEYFNTFHKPMLERARERVGEGALTILDVACGPAMELQFFDEEIHGALTLVATDISPDILPSVRERYGNTVLAFAADVCHSPLRSGVADVALLVNAMIYSPAGMLQAVTGALKAEGEVAVNFRDFSNPHNAAFYEYYLSHGGVLLDREIQVSKTPLEVKVLDYTNCVDDDGEPEQAIRQLGQQLYFTSPADIEAVATSTGLQVVSRAPFQFESPVNPNNEIDVFVLKKAA